ncbi:hypothetical protein [Nocardia sp. NPDC051832]|uniref:hypothetical protein n=1 Tax=Nocardia sp. NPDC051832 TaxID=3155673 RepID=UPI0034482D72
MTEEHRPDPQDERATLGMLLSANADLVVEVLRPAAGDPKVPVLAALTATRNLSRLVDDILHTLARQAREEGHTWAELGDLLGTSRQAAFQRFSGPMPPLGPFPHPPMPPFPPGPPAAPNFQTPPGPPPAPSFPAPPGPPAAPDFRTPPTPPGFQTPPSAPDIQAPPHPGHPPTPGHQH